MKSQSLQSNFSTDYCINKIVLILLQSIIYLELTEVKQKVKFYCEYLRSRFLVGVVLILDEIHLFLTINIHEKFFRIVL